MTVFDFVERFILFVIPGVIANSMFCYLTGKKPLADLLSVSYVFIASIFSFIVGNFLLQLVNFFPCIEFQLVEVTQILGCLLQSSFLKISIFARRGMKKRKNGTSPLSMWLAY